MDQQKMLLISSTTNDWPQIEDDDDQSSKGMMGSTTTPVGGAARLMEKPGQEQLQQQQQSLKCPRCDSANTKFCYYNNYSLSQPRHFCKACKRYWTRGGTLRNVPVGGGCRKNKRVRRPSSASAVDNNNGTCSSNSSVPPNTATSQQNNIRQIDLDSNSNHHPLFYGLGMSNHQSQEHHLMGNMNPLFTASGLDHLNALGLGFGDHRFNPAKQIQDIVAANSLQSSIFNSPSNYSSATGPTMASVLASKFINGGFKDNNNRGSSGNNNHYFQNLLPFEDLQIAAAAGNGGCGEAAKEVKVEDGGQNRMEWGDTTNNDQQSGAEQMGLSSDPALYWSSGPNNWHDPANLGSSVTSLI